MPTTKPRRPGVSPPPPARNFSVREAAYVVGVPEARIQRAIDRSVLPAGVATSRGRARREIALPSLLVYALEQSVSPHLKFTKATRSRLLRALVGVTQETIESSGVGFPGLREFSLGPSMVMDADALLQPFVDAVRRVAASRAWVVSDPEIRGGECVVRGTRVPIARLADLRSLGELNTVLLEDHPSLTPESLEAALLYTELHPRIGRPVPPPPWRPDSEKRVFSDCQG